MKQRKNSRERDGSQRHTSSSFQTVTKRLQQKSSIGSGAAHLLQLKENPVSRRKFRLRHVENESRVNVVERVDEQLEGCGGGHGREVGDCRLRRTREGKEGVRRSGCLLFVRRKGVGERERCELKWKFKEGMGGGQDI